MSEMRKYEDMYEFSYEMRHRFLEIFTRMGFGHVTSAFSLTEILGSLYLKVMNYCTEEPGGENRDRLVISKGHGAGMLFPIFESVGYFTPEEMDEMLRIGGSYERLQQLFYPGFEFYGGSLGQGLGMAAGMALGAKLNRESWHTYCILGDAECYEGSVWEAALFAGQRQLNNLVVIVDRNALGCSEFTENMLPLEPFAMKWEACGWETVTVDGHCYEELIPVLQESRHNRSAHPLAVIARTVKGKGLEHLYDKPLMHGYVPKSAEEIEIAFKNLKKY